MIQSCPIIVKGQLVLCDRTCQSKGAFHRASIAENRTTGSSFAQNIFVPILVKFQQRYQMRHRNSRSEDLCRGGASAVYEPVGSTPSPPHSLSGEMIALNHPNRSVR